MIGSRIITTEFDNKRFWKFTMALGRKLSDGRLFFTKLFLTVHVPELGVALEFAKRAWALGRRSLRWDIILNHFPPYVRIDRLQRITFYKRGLLFEYFNENLRPLRMLLLSRG